MRLSRISCRSVSSARSCHSMSALVCGLDVHKESTYATIRDEEGKVVNQTKMNNERMILYLEGHKVRKVAMESSTAVAPLFRQLSSKRYEVVVFHPKNTPYFAVDKIKSDPVDSKALAELVRLDASLWLTFLPEK
jgi:transposase